MNRDPVEYELPETVTRKANERQLSTIPHGHATTWGMRTVIIAEYSGTPRREGFWMRMYVRWFG